eukprot:1651978-Prymnesium_polylepis.2
MVGQTMGRAWMIFFLPGITRRRDDVRRCCHQPCYTCAPAGPLLASSAVSPALLQHRCPLAGLLSDGRPPACATPPGRLEDGAPL